MTSENPIFTGVELGTGSIKVIVAEIDENQAISILGFGESPSHGMSRGESTKTNLTAEQFRQALDAAEASAGVSDLSSFPFFLSLSGCYIETHRLSKSMTLNPIQPITQEQVETLLHDAITMVSNSSTQIVLNVVSRCFRLSQDRVFFNPVGQFSPEMELEIEYFIADSERLNTTVSVLSEFIDISQLCVTMYAPLAISAAIASRNYQDETLPLIIDIGGGMTSIIMPSSIGYMACEQIPVGCEHIANDLDIGLGIGISMARRLVNQLSSLNCTAIAVKDGRARMINLNGSESSSARLIPASSIEIIVEERLRELLEIVRKRLIDSQAYSLLGNEILLSGGGALIPRITELAYQVFNRKIRIARPFDVSGNTGLLSNPQYNTVIGLIRAGYRDLQIQKKQKNSRGLSQIFKIAGNFLKMLSE